MSRFERQEQIYQEILSVETELIGCPHGSPRWFELRNRLHALLREYVAVPQDPPPAGARRSRQSVWLSSHMIRGPIWITAVTLLLMLPFMATLGRDFPWIPPFWCVLSVGCLAWAIWASCPQKE